MLPGSAKPMQKHDPHAPPASIRAPRVTPTITIADATAHLDAILRLRAEIYEVEGGFRPQPGDAAAHSAPLARNARAWQDASDARSVHALATVNGVLVGALRALPGADDELLAEVAEKYDLARFAPVVPRTRMAVVSRFALRREWRAGPLALDLFVAMARCLRARGVALTFGDCRFGLAPFYTSLGLQTYAAPYHDAIGGALLPLLLPTGDLEHLRRVGSPLASLVDDSAPAVDDVALAVRELVGASPVVLGSKSHPALFARALDVLGPPPHASGPLAGLSAAELRNLLAPSYVVDWPAGRTLLARGQPISERWILLEGDVLVDGEPAPPLSIVGGADTEGGLHQAYDARIGPRGARLLSLDERKLGTLLAAPSRLAERLRENVRAHGARRAPAEGTEDTHAC